MVDRRGNVTCIDQRTTGDQWEEIQKRLGGIDRAELMNVAEAKEVQRDANRAEFRAQKEAERAQERIKEPVGKTAGDIRTAWILSRDAENPARDIEQLTEALAARGFGIARVTAAEAYESERLNAFVEEIGNRANRAPVSREGELVAVNGFGNVYRFDERTTGQLCDEIDKRLAGIDPAELMSVADTKEAMREADRAAYAEARERARPATAIEQTIHDCREKARQLGAEIKQDGELELKTVHGAAAFAGRLDQAGIAIVRVTAADEKALDALRADQDMERLAAETNVEARRAHYFDDVKAGEIAAVDRFGNVHRLNPYKLNLEDIERRLLEAGNARLPGVTEARAAFEIAGEAAATRKDEAAHARQLRAENFEAERASARFDAVEIKGGIKAAEREVEAAPMEAERAGRDGLRILAKVAEVFLGLFGGWAMAPPKLTPEQAKQEARAEEEAAPARAAAAQEAAEWKAQEDEREGRRRSARQLEESQLARILGNTSPSEAQRGVDAERTRERERQRDRY